MLYNIKVILTSGKVEVYRCSLCKRFLSKGWRQMSRENYIMYNSSVEIAVVY